MIKITKVMIEGFEPAIRGMRNPMNSWDKSDSEQKNYRYVLGENDATLCTGLAKGGSVHAKYRRFIQVWCDIEAPLYWWKEFDTYRMGVEKNSCSTMHKIHSKEFTLEDFSTDHLDDFSWNRLDDLIGHLNICREKFINAKDKSDWWQMIQLLPSSYNQKRTVMMSYEALANMYHSRKGHKLDEWVAFCFWIENLPLAKEMILVKENHE